MKFKDQGLVINVKDFGSTSAVITVFSKEHGKITGFVKGGRTGKKANLYQICNLLDFTWYGRLDDQLGGFDSELLKSYSGICFNDRQAIAMIFFICEALDKCFKERQESQIIYDKAINLLDFLCQNSFTEQEQKATLIKKWAVFCLHLLKDLGIAINLKTCVVTGEQEDLAYVSPRSAGAVSKKAATGYEDKLLKYPDILRGNINNEDIKQEDLLNLYNLIDYFLSKAEVILEGIEKIYRIIRMF